MWRKHNSHREETKAVKEALRKVGINAVVGHGTGTAWGWLEINIGAGQQFGEHNYSDWHCPHCISMRKMAEQTIFIAQEVTGRNGDYHGNILILQQDHWDRKLNKRIPINHPNYSPPCLVAV